MKKLVPILLSVLLLGCNKPKFDPEWTKEVAPVVFHATFETTEGNFNIEVQRQFSPKAADRLYQLIRHGYYDHAIFYRVVPNFVAQFGNTDTIVMSQWRSVKIPDEKVRLSNKKGTLSFARDGKNSRDLELFINLKDNTVLDTLDFQGVRGFPAIGKVTQGMETVEKLYSGYSENTMDNENLYLNPSLFYQAYPQLDVIKKAYLIESK